MVRKQEFPRLWHFYKWQLAPRPPSEAKSLRGAEAVSWNWTRSSKCKPPPTWSPTWPPPSRWGPVGQVTSELQIRWSQLKRGQDSVKDNLLRFIQWSWNTPSYCYKYLLWFHSLYSDINVTIPGASILKSWKKGTQFANKMENVSLSSTIPVTKVSMADR